MPSIATKEIGKEAYRVLFVILENVEYGLFSEVTPVAIARILECDPSSVKRAVRTLTEKGIIRKRHASRKLIGYEVLGNFQMDG
ncbi:MAG: MarR family transcriptional regulator [Nostoc indistinguendum CM1-VF10]|jgi:DNA-binding MarR family transcriptional regulator|nr:MarR family transcriptional regulator [Nostoc indistinguendum CM1-VF10]